MGEQRQESGSAPGAPALHRARRYVQDTGGFRDGVPLHVHEDEGGALIGGEGTERLQELAVQIIPLGRGGSRLVRIQQLFQALGVVDGSGLPGRRLAGTVQAGVHRDPVQPRRDGRLSPEGVCGPVGRDESVLNGVSGLLAVSQRPEGHGPEPVPVAPHDLTEGVGVTIDVAREQVRVCCLGVDVITSRPRPCCQGTVFVLP